MYSVLEPQPLEERVDAVIRLTRRAIARNDDAAYRLLLGIVEDEELWRHMENDDGTPATLANFESDMLTLARELGTYED